MTIKWNLPDNDAPGFLRRKREITALLDAPPTPQGLDKLLKFLIQFVDDEDKDVLLDASKVEYGQAVMHLLGYSNTVTDPKGGKSEQQ